MCQGRDKFKVFSKVFVSLDRRFFFGLPYKVSQLRNKKLPIKISEEYCTLAFFFTW